MTVVLPVAADAAAASDRHPTTLGRAAAPLQEGIGAAVAVAAAHAGAVDAEGRFPAEALAELRRQRLLAALVPVEHGGLGLSLAEAVEHCHAVAKGCASAAMVLAMHHIQVACAVAHAGDAPWQHRFLRRLAAEQPLLASVTSEAGIGGNIRASACALAVSGDRFTVEKRATAISYGAHADALLLTARRTPEAAASDQVLVVLERGDYALEGTGGAWDALGMRGTCSSGFVVRGGGGTEQVLAAPFGDIATDTMLPVSHAVWAGVWTGIAASALERARAFVRADARSAHKTGHTFGAARLAEAATLLHGAEGALIAALRRIGEPGQPGTDARGGRFVAEMNLLKLHVSEAANAVVRVCMGVCGFAGYSNKTPFSLGRHLRDVQSSSLMVGNDRIREGTGNLMLMHRLDFGNFRR